MKSCERYKIINKNKNGNKKIMEMIIVTMIIIHIIFDKFKILDNCKG